MRRQRSPTLSERGLATAVGFVIGGFASGWSIFSAQAAVDVRPRLETVDFVTALLTAHGSDWLFYHMPWVGTVLTVLLVVVTFNVVLEVLSP